MYDCIKNNHLEGLFNYLTLYKSHLENEEKINFQPTDEFRSVYGEHSDLCDEPSLLVTNVDLNFENLILDDHQKFKVIDYEWVFVFPIPLEYVFYRVLGNFYYKYNDQISRMISFNFILEHYGIHASKADTYRKMEQSFRSFVGYEWTKLSERYSQKKTKLIDLIKASQKE